MDKRQIRRRQFLKMSATAVVGAVAAACGAQGTPIVIKETVPVKETVQVPVKETVPVVVKQTEVVKVTVEVPKKMAEPPMLKPLVDAGKLPPVEKRLPDNPVVVGGREAIGVYGGELRMIHLSPTWFIENYDLNSERMLHYSDIDLRTIVPNILESWSVTPDGKTYTIKLRKGMKWSDGEPLTTEDVRFWWEDYYMNEELVTSPPWQFRFGGEPMKVQIVDDFTFKITFAATFGNFPAHLTRFEPGNNPSILAPSHYLKKYHAKYTDKAKLEALAKENKLENWAALFNNRIGWGMGVWQGPDHVVNENYPVLSPWHIVSRPQEGLYLWERNPYYWKVDLAGNQLPYIDKLRYDLVSNDEAVKLKIAQSELDMVGQHSVTMADYPFYKENEAKANYQVADLVSCMSDRYVLFPQHYIKDDPVLTQIVNHPNFVKALSVAIDRDEINQSLFFGMARMGQISPLPNSKYYKEKYGTAWAQYDKNLANKLLDEMGLKKGPDGIRLRPDGKPLKFNIEHAGPRVGPVTNKLTEMVATYWREVGIDATTKEIQESLYNERMLGYQVHCGVWHQDRCTDMLLHIQPQWFIPTGDPGQGTACSAWAVWYNAADRSAPGLIEPPPEVKKLYDLFDKMTAVVDEDERVKLGQQIFDWLADNPLEIGLVLECPAPLLFNKNLRNLPRPKSPMGWDTYGVSTYHPEAFYYEGGKRA